MVNNHGPASGPAIVRPSELLREAGVGVRQEELLISTGIHILSVFTRVGTRHTISSFTLLAFPQALITNGSLEATTATTSTPLPLTSERRFR